MNLYNKYRPTSFDDLIQGAHVKNLQNDMGHHAYLFFGPPGTGKTTAARLCMAAINNIDASRAGQNPDYIEINCAVNNGVDDVRELISTYANTMPASCKTKFIVLDEAHLLTPQAQNALLKTVEEPQAHIKFIFCTTEIGKVLPTIRSRCQIIPFYKLKAEDILLVVKRVADKEKMDYHIDSLTSISENSDGSARSAINVLEQCSSVISDPSAVNAILGTAAIKDYEQLTTLLMNKDSSKAIIFLDSMLSGSMDPSGIINRYGDYVSSLIIRRLNKDVSVQWDGKKLIFLGEAITNILKDFKILQNITLISKIHFLKLVAKIQSSDKKVE